MKNPRFEKVRWDQYEKDCLKVVQSFKKISLDKIVAISRGGLVAARILSDLLSVSISHITISSYKDLRQKKEAIIDEFPSRPFKNETILLVDEICDTGKTFERAISYFKSLQPKKIYTLALYLKPKSHFVPDFWVKKTDAWVIFPYELRETYQAFIKLYKSKAKQKLIEVGFKKWEIAEL